MTTHFAQTPLAQITASLTNLRKTFNPAKMAELTASIKAMGVHQPVLLRPLPPARLADTAHLEPRPEFELVAGERRLRASIAAGMQTIPAMVRALTDSEVLEIQIVENLQRDDLTELEEAEGYEALMAHSQLSADQVGAKIGKSRSYVYGRLKLLDLSMECKQAMREGQIDASRAILIARIPDAKLQAKALAEATEQDYQGEVCSVRTFQSWLQKNVMLRLEHAPFKITDARLLAEAGSCKECPKRTGANPDLFADVTGADICTDPTCYRAKEEAHREALVSKAQAKGMTVITGKEAMEICPANHRRNHLVGYTALSQVRADCTADGDKAPTLRELLGKDAPAPVLIEHPATKELIEAVPTEEAEAVLLAKGLIKTLQKTSDLQDDIDWQLKHIESKTKWAQRNAKYHAVVDAIRAIPDKNAAFIITPEVLRAWFQELLGYGDADQIAEHFDMQIPDDVEDIDSAVAMHIRASGNAALQRALARHMLQENSLGFGTTRASGILDALAASLSLDTTALEKQAASEVKAETAAELKRLKAELKQSTEQNAEQTAPTPMPPAAQATGGGGRGKKTAQAAPRAPKPKLRAQEAMLGIADALQGLETPDSARRSGEAPVEQQPAPDAGLYAQAVALVKREQKASKRLLKDHLGIGQDKALALLGLMEMDGIVGPVDESRSRKVLVAA